MKTEYKDSLNDIVGDIYCEGFLDGQLAMIKTIRDLGLVNKVMEKLIRGAITGKEEMDEHHTSREEMTQIIDTAIQKIKEISY